MTFDLNNLPGHHLVPPRYRKAVLFAVFAAAGCFLAALFGEAWLAVSLRAAAPVPQTRGTVVLLIDTSGSMDGAVGGRSRLDAARDAGKRFCRELVRQNVDVGITRFDSFAAEVQPPTRVVALLDQALDSLRASGGTAMDAGLAEAANALRNATAGPRAVVLFTDGDPDNADAAALAAATLRGQNVTLIAVGTEDATQATLLRLTGDPALVKTTSSGAIDVAFQDVQQQLMKGALIAATAPDAGFAATLLAVALWTGLIAVGLVLCLILGQNLYVGKHPLSPRQLKLGVAGGLASGVAAGCTALILYRLSGVDNRFVDTLLNVLGWAILGALLGLGVSKVVPNLRADRAVIGGVIGGVAGAIVYNLFRLYSYPLARIAGAPVLGACIGLAIAWVDMALSRAWLEVIWSPKDVRHVNLGPEPVRVGGDRERCDVVLRDAPAEAYRYRFDHGRVTVEDIASGAVTEIASGDERRVGKVTLRVNTAAAAAAIAAPTAPATPAAPAKGGNGFGARAGAPPRAVAAANTLEVAPAFVQVTPTAAVAPAPVRGVEAARTATAAAPPSVTPVSPPPSVQEFAAGPAAPPVVIATVVAAAPPARAPSSVQAAAAAAVAPAGPAQVRIQLADGGIVTIVPGRPLLGALLGAEFGAANVAELVTNPAQPAVLGLRNTGQVEWVVKRTSGDSSRVAPGKTLRVELNAQLHIGAAVVRIV